MSSTSRRAKRGELAADADFLANIDRTNHWDRPPTDKDGRTTFPALIPGATYRIHAICEGQAAYRQRIQRGIESVVDLGEIVIERRIEERCHG